MSNNLDDRVWQEILRRVHRADEFYVKVGIIGQDASASHGDATNAEVGTAHEYGTEDLPERSFLRSTFVRREGDLAKLQAQACRGILEGKIDAQRALALIGAWAAGAVRATITRDGEFVPLKPATIARKGSSRPLVDTGQLVGSISFVVVTA